MLTSRTFVKRTRAGAVVKIDVLEDPAIKNVIVLQTVLQEVRNRSAPVYKRIRDMIQNPEKHFYSFTNEHHRETYIEQKRGETSNDRNDRAIRVAVNWYNEHLKKIEDEEKIQVIFLTNDRTNKEKALEEGITAYTCEEYIKSLTANPELVDRLACVSDEGIIVQGLKHLNRAIHEDIVAVELLPKNEWVAPSSVVLQDDGQNEDDIENEEEKENMLKITVNKDMLRPTGKVVGIIKRNWRPYCGMLSKSQIKEARRHLFTPADRRIPRIRIETRQAETLEGQRIIVAIDGWPRNSRYPNDMKHREDLRHLNVCSVDPPGCTDIDDALHCREIENGNIEVGVHIADVSHFIRPGNALDEESVKRGTTVYLCEKRIDMVPELLSSNLCSLRSNVDRLAFSCIWEMNHKAEILKTRFTKSIINSKASLTYAEAQMRIDSATMNDEITTSLRGLNKLAKILKKKRIENGALTLSSPEVRFHIDSETHDPIDLQTKELKETNSMVEEFMLLANISVAQKIYDEFPEFALLRKHPAPPPSNYDILNLEIKTDSAKALAESLDKAESPTFPYLNTLLRILTTRCMMQAVYFCSGMDNDFHHYGLASPIYTHFTSPIRRYADIIVHRLLAVAIGADSTYPELTDKHKLADMCKNLNYRHKMAQYAQRASVAFHTQVPSLTVEGTTLHVFDKVKVNITLDDSNIQHQKMRMVLVEPKILGKDVPANPSTEASSENEPEKKKQKLQK
ncbi:Exosome complex exonuclease RRP44 [Pitangus sulphuratus]|nr:Exosome complex exonuclease RRP44 [Pitangus sulphuratus]